MKLKRINKKNKKQKQTATLMTNPQNRRYSSKIRKKKHVKLLVQTSK